MPTVLGIDPSSRKIAVVVSQRPKGKFKVYTRTLSANHVYGAGQAFSYVRRLLRAMPADTVVYMEAPVLGRGGAKATIPQSQIGGAVMAACAIQGVPLTLVNNASWKKRVCGRGNLDKAGVAASMEKVWPELFAQAKGDQDVLDAGAINLFGWHTLTLRSRLKRGKR